MSSPYLSSFPITPFNEDGIVDTTGLRALIKRCLDAKVPSIGVLGSTGSYPYLTRTERRRAVAAAVEEVDGRAEVLAGIGALCTRDVIQLARDAKEVGASAGLLAPVSYQQLTEDEVFKLFEDVAAAVPGFPLVIYHNKNTTHFEFSQQLVRRLSALPVVTGVKNPAATSAADARDLQLKWQHSVTRADFTLGYSGDTRIVESLIAGGGAWFSVVGGVLPESCMAIVSAVQRGDADEARRLHARMQPLWDLFDELSSYRVAYAIVNILGLCAQGTARPPLPVLPLDEEATTRVADVLRLLNLNASRV